MRRSAVAMLFDLSMTELMLIGMVALIFIGPKDLPKALRVAGYWVKKARTLSREFHSSVEQMIREAELDEMRQELKKASEIDLEKEFHNTIDPTGSLAESLKPPELPKFSEADLPASPISAPETGALPAPEAGETGALPKPEAGETGALPKPEAGETGALPKPEAGETETTETAAPALAPQSAGQDSEPQRP
jgi:sec-independent protein translocase protein TatB